MKSITNICCKKTKPLTFPRLMKGRDSGMIYLMLNERQGIVVLGAQSYPNWPIGRMWDTPTLNNLEDYHGTITLSND